MRAQVHALRWPELELGQSIDERAHACELLEMYVCPQGEPGEERFQLTARIPSALADQLQQHPFLIGHHSLFVPELHTAEVAKWLSDRIAVLEAPTGSELAKKIGRIGEWEFEDYDG